jgi:hypothetical protein
MHTSLSSGKKNNMTPPSVVIGADIAATGGDPKLAQAAANRFLYNQREQLEIASRLALIISSLL